MRARSGFAAFCLFFLSLPLPAFAQNFPTIYVGLVSITPSNAPVLAAYDGGYFKKQGLEVKPLIMSGSSTAVAALLSGNVNLVSMAGSGLINAHLGGTDAVMVAGMVNFAPYELIVGKEIQKLKNLKGKKLGIARFGGSADFLARWGLEKNGLKPGKDVIILQTGGNAERVAALSQGAIQATLLEQAFAHMAKKAGYKSLLDYSTAGLDYQHNGIGSTKSYMDKNREAMIRFMRAMVEGIHRFKTDRAFGLKVLERHLRVTDADIVQTAYDYYAPKTPAVPYVNVKGMKFVLDTLADTNPKAKSAKAEEMVDHRALQEVEASGFVKQVTASK
jgi:ABC-type nitrate/sulfonate/bicarbonate transport system substrate-binding protein